MLKLSGLFAEDGEEFHEVYCLRRSNKHQLSEAGSRKKADQVEVRFRGLEGDQIKKSGVLVIMTRPSRW